MTAAHESHRQIERIGLRAWPSVETVEYDGWVLRASGGYTKRANSVNPHFASSLPLTEKIARCEAFYTERGLPTIFRLTPFSQPTELDEALACAGYTTLDRTLVMTTALDGIPNTAPALVRFTEDAEWLDAFDRLRALEADKRAHHRRIIEAAEGERLLALVEPNGAPIACGLGIIVDKMLGLFDLFTSEDHRHRGHGTAIVEGILRRAAARGAQSAYLKVHSENLPAQRLYARFGFETAYRYWYRIGPQPQVG